MVLQSFNDIHIKDSTEPVLTQSYLYHFFLYFIIVRKSIRTFTKEYLFSALQDSSCGEKVNDMYGQIDYTSSPIAPKHMHPEIKSSSSKTSDGCRVNAKDIVVATNAPIIDNTTSKIYDKQEPHRCM